MVRKNFTFGKFIFPFYLVETYVESWNCFESTAINESIQEHCLLRQILCYTFVYFRVLLI